MSFIAFAFLLSLFTYVNIKSDKVINTNVEYVDKVLLGGDSIGLSIGSHVEIIGFNSKENGLEKEDIIISIDGKDVKSIDNTIQRIKTKLK